MEKGGAGPEVIRRECARMIEESKERPVTDFEKEMTIFLVVSTRIGVVEDDRQDQRHAENVFVKTPRRLRVPAAQADMIDMPQRVPRARLEGSKPVFFRDLDIRETTPQGILIPNDILMLRHDTLARSPDRSEVDVCVQTAPLNALQSDQLPRTADLVAWLSAPLGAAIKPPWQFDTIMRLQSGAELS